MSLLRQRDVRASGGGGAFRQKGRRWSFFSLRRDPANSVMLTPPMHAEPAIEREQLIQRPTLVTEK